MKKYDVTVHELQWRYVIYRIEAESEEEARDLADVGEGTVILDDFDTIEQIDVESVYKV